MDWGVTRGVPESMAKRFFAEWERIPQWDQIGAWVRGSMPFLTLFGTNGTGKTWAALATMAAFHKLKANQARRYADLGRADWFPGSHQRFYKFSDMWLDYTSSYAGGTTSHLVKSWEAPDLAIIDDVGIKTPTPGFLEAFYAIMDRRMESGKRTVITTNLPPSELGEVLGHAMASRLLSGMGIELGGDDRRMKPSQASN